MHCFFRRLSSWSSFSHTVLLLVQVCEIVITGPIRRLAEKNTLGNRPFIDDVIDNIRSRGGVWVEPSAVIHTGLFLQPNH